MPLIAATATNLPVPGWLILAVAAILATGWYVAHCAWWPFAACMRCSGSGKRRSPSGKAWRTCRRCKGSGARLRTGRRVWNFVRSKREAGR